MIPGIPEAIWAGLDHCKVAKFTIGEPLNIQGATLVPVVSISAAYGGITSREGTGGGGIKLDPVAIVVLRDNHINVFAIQKRNSIDKLAELLPGILTENNSGFIVKNPNNAK